MKTGKLLRQARRFPSELRPLTNMLMQKQRPSAMVIDVLSPSAGK